MTVRKLNKGDLVEYDANRIVFGDYIEPEIVRAVIEDAAYADEEAAGKEPIAGREQLYGVIRENGYYYAWIPESILTLIEPNRYDIAEQWIYERKKKEEKQRDLDWIFTSITDVRELPSLSIEALARCLGIHDMWGPVGEGSIHTLNLHRVQTAVSPFIEAHDKEGWLRYCEEINKET